ncbi:MAG: DUF177 domain-containing protein [Clostridia bacterium]|nr:DUF177 domain-containing protein [Clostridia bacterium]
MKVSLKELRSGVCSHIDFDYTIDLSKEEVNFEFPFEKPVRFSGSISDMAGVLNLSADIEAEVHSRCARCGKAVEYLKQVPVDFVLVSENDGTADEGDGVFTVGDEVDLDEILVSELIINMDMITLCSEDCKGLCYKCGHDLNLGECGCDRSGKISPFADLAKLFENDNN